MRHLREHVPLAPLTTLETGGAARFLVEAGSEEDVHSALDFAQRRSCPVLILGGGSNILVSDRGFDGLVVRMTQRGCRAVGEASGEVLEVAAGEPWDAFVRRCVEKNLAGIECMSGIPGTVGATPIQNVGAYGQEVSDVIASMRVLDRKARDVLELSGNMCGFAYRSSIFNTSHREHYVILSVTFTLTVGGEPRITHDDLRRHLDKTHTKPSLLEVREAVMAVRARKGMLLTPDDPDCRSAGSFFKNPIVNEEKARAAEEKARALGRLAVGENIPRFAAAAGQVKLPAAWLLEQAGFRRGHVHGRVGLSAKHTLALINRGGATAADVLALMSEIQEAVEAIFGIVLHPEPVMVGFD